MDGEMAMARTLAALPEGSLIDPKPDLVRCAVEGVRRKLSLNGISDDQGV